MADDKPYYSSFLYILGAIPIDVFIIYRLSSKTVMKSNYFRLIMVLCSLNIYVSISGVLDFVNDIIARGEHQRIFFPLTFSLFNYNHIILHYCYGVHNFLILTVLIHWKTVLVKKRRLDIFLYVASSVFFLAYHAGERTIQEGSMGDENNSTFQKLYNALLSIYFALYSSVAIYCYVVLRRVDTSSYSSPTLKIYKRMTLVHFTQTSLVVGEFIYTAPLRVILVAMFGDNFGRESDTYFAFIFYFGTIQYCYVAVKPCIQSIFLFWALRGVLRPQGNAEGGVTATLAAGALRIFARRTVEGAAGTVAAPSQAQDPLQDP